MALPLRLPVVYLVDCSGCSCPSSRAVLRGRTRRRAHLQEERPARGAGVPQVAGVFGDCIAGGGYMPIISDRVYMTESAYMVIAGAALIRGAKSLKLTSLDIGGPEVHVHQSACADVRVPDDPTAHPADPRGDRPPAELGVALLPPRRRVRRAPLPGSRALRAVPDGLPPGLRHRGGDRPPGRRLALPRGPRPHRARDGHRARADLRACGWGSSPTARASSRSPWGIGAGPAGRCTARASPRSPVRRGPATTTASR